MAVAGGKTNGWLGGNRREHSFREQLPGLRQQPVGLRQQRDGRVEDEAVVRIFSPAGIEGFAALRGR